MEDQKCRICGCTENDCSQCIKLTGKPCHWVEPELCSACADAIDKSNLKMSMSFFRLLAGVGNVDMSIRIMQKDDTFTINIMPGSATSKTKPFIVSATAEELDAKFFDMVMPEAVETQGLVITKGAAPAESNEDDDPEEDKQPAAKKSVPKKKVAKAKPEKKASPKSDQPTQQLFPDA